MKTNKFKVDKNCSLSQWEKRVIVFKFMYSILINEELSIDEIIIKMEKELPNDEYITSIIYNFINKKNEYIDLLQKNLKENWTVKRLDYIDKAIIFSSICEYHVHKLDKKVIIDQAIITAKNYGTDVSYKFINFILDKVI